MAVLKIPHRRSFARGFVELKVGSIIESIIKGCNNEALYNIYLEE
jgi:hypothetical protein